MSKNIKDSSCEFSTGFVNRLYKLSAEAIFFAEPIPINKTLIMNDSLGTLNSLIMTNPSNEIYQQIIKKKCLNSCGFLCTDRY